MTVNKTDFLVPDQPAPSSRAPSASIWGPCPIADILENPGTGFYFYDDFRDMPLIGTQTTQIGFGKYKVFATASASVAPVSSINSVAQVTDALAESVVLSTSASLAQAYQQCSMSGNHGTDGILWFEACVAISVLTATSQGFFLGLGETQLFTLATAVPLNGTAATPTNSGALIGFNCVETGPVPINAVYTDRATSFTKTNTGVSGTQPGSFNPTTAYVFTKLGFVYNPALSANCVTWYQDGVPFPNYLSNATLVATTNLKANPLGLMFSTVGTGTGASYMKWWRLAQLFV